MGRYGSCDCLCGVDCHPGYNRPKNTIGLGDWVVHPTAMPASDALDEAVKDDKTTYTALGSETNAALKMRLYDVAYTTDQATIDWERIVLYAAAMQHTGQSLILYTSLYIGTSHLYTFKHKSTPSNSDFFRIQKQRTGGFGIGPPATNYSFLRLYVRGSVGCESPVGVAVPGNVPTSTISNQWLKWGNPTPPGDAHDMMAASGDGLTLYLHYTDAGQLAFEVGVPSPDIGGKCAGALELQWTPTFTGNWLTAPLGQIEIKEGSAIIYSTTFTIRSVVTLSHVLTTSQKKLIRNPANLSVKITRLNKGNPAIPSLPAFCEMSDIAILSGLAATLGITQTFFELKCL